MSQKKVLEVTLISAKDLKDVNLFSKMDVYAVASIDGDARTTQRTPTDRNGGTSPSWDAKLRFPLDPARSGGALHVLLRAERALGDRDVGEVHVPIRELLNGAAGRPQFVSYQVRKPGSGKSKGVLNISYDVIHAAVSDGPYPTAAAAKPPVAYPSPAATAPAAPAYPFPAASAAAAYPSPASSTAAAYPSPASSTAAAYPPPGKAAKSDEPVTAYPAAASASASAYPYAPPPPAGYPSYPPPPQYGYGAQPPPQYGYGAQAPPPPAGYGYPPAGYGYGAAPPQQPQKKNKFGMGLGAGLLGGALGGLLIGDVLSDASSYDNGYDAGFDDAGGFGF